MGTSTTESTADLTAEVPSSTELDRRWSLVLPHRAQAFRVARARTTSDADAEDVVSEALLRVVTMPELRDQTVSGLLSTVTMRLAMDVHRRDARARRLESRVAGDTTAPVDEAVVDLDEARWLAELLPTLKQQEREVLLHRAAGHTVGSTAEQLGLSYKAVESTYTRARSRLRHAWLATLGLVAPVVVPLRRSLGRSAPVSAGLVTAAFSTALFALPILPQQVPAGVPETRVQMPSLDAAVQAPARDAATAGSAAAPRTTRQGQGPSGRGPAGPPPGERVVGTGPVGRPGLVQSETTLTHYDDEAGPVQSVVNCLQTYEFTVTSLDCDTSGKSSEGSALVARTKS